MIITLKELMDCLQSPHITKASYLYMKCNEFMEEMIRQNTLSIQVKQEDMFDAKAIKNLALIQRNSEMESIR